MVSNATSPGIDAKGLEKVEEIFRRQLDDGLHPGAAMAVYHRDKLVLDLWGGVANAETGEPVREDTMFVIFSCSKPLAAFCWHIMW